MKTRTALVFAGLVLAFLVVGFLTMTDPAPKHPQQERSPAYIGSSGDAPEIAPAQP
jgi:hypothetical protein